MSLKTPNPTLTYPLNLPFFCDPHDPLTPQYSLLDPGCMSYLW